MNEKLWQRKPNKTERKRSEKKKSNMIEYIDSVVKIVVCRYCSSSLLLLVFFFCTVLFVGGDFYEKQSDKIIHKRVRKTKTNILSLKLSAVSLFDFTGAIIEPHSSVCSGSSIDLFKSLWFVDVERLFFRFLHPHRNIIINYIGRLLSCGQIEIKRLPRVK